jgi:hypothetical protein
LSYYGEGVRDLGRAFFLVEKDEKALLGKWRDVFSRKKYMRIRTQQYVLKKNIFSAALLLSGERCKCCSMCALV